MSANNTVDYRALTWVKKELDETLLHARQALESYVDTPGDSVLLHTCVDHLHQVAGTLQIVELNGAALLVEEMEQLARKLLEDAVQQKDDAYEVLMRAILQLPDYLERLQSGQPDRPIVLLPLLNELRAARGENPFSEQLLFNPDLSIVRAPDPARDASLAVDGKKLREKARKLRHRYQVGLLEWYRGQDAAGGLRVLADAVAQLEEMSSSPPAVQLWWIASALIEALMESGLEPAASVKQLLGQVDRQIKRLIDEGEEGLEQASPAALVKDLLYYVAQAKSNGERVQEIKKAFRLAELLPREEELIQAREGLSAPSSALLQDVATVIKEDLARIKDALDVFMRAENPQPSALAPLADVLRQVADTLHMLGLESARTLAQEQTAAISAIANGEAESSESRLFEMARTMLLIESALDDMSEDSSAVAHRVEEGAPADAAGSSATETEGNTAETLSESEFRQIVAATLHESAATLGVVKDAILAYIRTPDDYSLLVQVPQWFHEIQGSLRMLNLDRAVALLGGVRRYIASELLERRAIPSSEQLDTLADAITSVDWYLELTGEQGAGWESILDKAEQGVALLGYAIDEDRPVVVAETPYALMEHAEQISEGSPEAVLTKRGGTAKPFSFEGLELVPLATEESEPDFAEIASADSGLAGLTLQAEMDDSELLPLVEPTVEEAPDELTLEFVPMRAEDAVHPTDPEVAEPSPLGLIEFEAEAVSEPDDTLPEILIEDASAVHVVEEPVFELVEDMADGAARTPTFALEEGTSNANQALASAPEIPATATVQPASKPLAADLGEDILGVFIEEAEEELAVIQEYLPKWEAAPDDREALTRIRRSFHTLKGSGRLVGARMIGEFAWSFENMLNRVIDGTAMPTPAHFQLLGQAVAVLPLLIAQLKGAAAPETDVLRLMDQAQGLAQSDSLASQMPIGAALEEKKDEQGGIAETPVAGVAPIMDSVLYEIYSKEAFGHLEEIEHFIELCADNGACQVTDVLVRALHTLHGSSHMAGVTSIAEISAVFEKYAKAHRDAEVPVDMDGCVGLTDAVTFTRTILALLNVPDAVLPDHSALLARLADLAQKSLPEQAQEGPQELPREEPLATPPVAQFLPKEAPRARHERPPLVTPSPEEPDPELLGIFLEEAEEIIASSEIALQRWIQDQDNPALVASLQRELHTLKGGARMVGITAISDLSHALESLLTAVVDGWVTVSKRLFDVLQRSVDGLSGMLELARENRPLEPAVDLMAELAHVHSGLGADIADEREQPAEPEGPKGQGEPLALEEAPVQEPEAVARAEAGWAESSGQVEEMPSVQEERRAISRMQHELVRVRADLLDNLVNHAGEVSIYRSRLEQQAGVLRFNLAELDQTVSRLRDQLRRLELETEAQILARHEREASWHREDFDPLELDRYSQLQQLSRALTESASDLSSIQGLLENTTREAATLLLQQARVNTELQEGLMRTRMVPFAGLAGRLRRIVRQSCQELGKQAELRLVGTEGEMDRTVLDRIVAPLEHMLRNAVSHGIEMPAARAAAGKPETGNITLSLARDGGEVVIQVSDDGGGINAQAIRRKAIERGLLREDAEISDQDLLRFILEAGFSTAETVTQISGRGVGMDVVDNEIKQLGGSLEIHTHPGQGTRFTIRLPFTLAISQALLVQVGEEIFAVPLTGVEGIVRMSQDELERYCVGDAPLYEYAGQGYQVRYLSSLLNIGSHQMSGLDCRLPVLLVRTGDYRAALVVEALQGSREIVVKPMGTQLSTVRGVSGATILGDGRVVLILDLGTLVRLDAAMPSAVIEEVPPQAAQPSADDVTVMVVDDSITVRKVTANLLERYDMNVLTAKDGVDALAVLQEHRPDVMLLDIEMPRMDGYELATHIRNDERLHDLPIIMITSRTGEKHRQRAMEIGVNRYLGKPYQEAELLEHIKEVVHAARALVT